MTTACLDVVPQHLRIKVLLDDEDFIVIDKPPGLRSVPGHAIPWESRQAELSSSSSSSAARKDTCGEKNGRRTSQEAWEAAIRSFAGLTIPTEATGADLAILLTLSKSKSLASVPRKYKPFRRYIERNRYRLFPQASKGPSHSDEVDLDVLAKGVFQRIESRQQQFIGLPERTPSEESAAGQLELLGYGHVNGSRADDARIFVVHRLDCETSGVMVFARNQKTASFLSSAWRGELKRCHVQKVYWARVTSWPPLRNRNEKTGTIDLPLSKSKERLKWEVDTASGNGKPSRTEWTVLNDTDDHIDLELKPATGRTHQLRIHCAHVGSGIVGDSLYWDASSICAARRGSGTDVSNSSSDTKRQKTSIDRLHLHAYSLRFPHPRNSSDDVVVSSTPEWRQP